MSMQETPRTADVLSDETKPDQIAKEERVAVFSPSAVECCFGGVTLIGLAIAVGKTKHDVRFLWPETELWLDVIAAFALGCACNFVLAVVLWRRFSALGLAGVLLCLPYAIPFRFGIGASALAIINFIGVWKALDYLGGTCPVAIRSNGFSAFCLHLVSPVEYRTERINRARIVAAAPGDAPLRVCKVGLDIAGLAIAASVRSALSRPPPSGMPGAPHASHLLSGACDSALALYAEVWTRSRPSHTFHLLPSPSIAHTFHLLPSPSISFPSQVWTVFLFLSLFCDTFGALIGCAGYAPMTTFDAPLTRAVSLSDFWSRRMCPRDSNTGHRGSTLPIMKADRESHARISS